MIARRVTADGVHVLLWDDGAITGRLGYQIDGVTLVRPRSSEARARALRAGWLLLGECELYDAGELGALYEACRWSAERDGLPGTVRARLADQQRVVLRPVWTVISTDRDGRPTERVWRLPRLRWPGLAVWDFINHGRGGRYAIMRSMVGAPDTFEDTGLRFATLADLSAYLCEVGAARECCRCHSCGEPSAPIEHRDARLCRSCAVDSGWAQPVTLEDAE